MKRILLMLALLSAASAHACPINIHNNGRNTIIVIDANNHQSIIVPAGRTRMIDPSITSWWGRALASVGLMHETLDIHTDTGEETYALQYRIKESYCSSDVPTLTLGEIADWKDSPRSDRYRVMSFEPYVPGAHDHSDHEH